MRVLLDNELFRCVLDDPPGVARYTRTRVPWPSPDAMREAFKQLAGIPHEAVPPGTPLLLDVRAAIGRNDETYESVFAQYRAQMLGRYGRIAILVATPVGALQISRLQRESGLRQLETFTDEAEAIRHLLARD
jgi:hypothetical protein